MAVGSVEGGSEQLVVGRSPRLERGLIVCTDEQMADPVTTIHNTERLWTPSQLWRLHASGPDTRGAVDRTRLSQVCKFQGVLQYCITLPYLRAPRLTSPLPREGRSIKPIDPRRAMRE